jgi:hypothetical protein
MVPMDGPSCIRHLLNDRRDAAALVHQPRDCEAAFGLESAKARLLRLFTELSSERRLGWLAAW